MDSIRAYTIVRFIASQGLEAAQVAYGRDLCNQARFTLRASIARRQATRSRIEGAGAKWCARDCRKAQDMGWSETARHFEKLSKRAYRAAQGYDQTAMFAEYAAVAAMPRPVPASADRFAHFQPA